jgi:hypothetical protein
MKPLSMRLDRAILQAAARLRWEARPDAPDTFEALRAAHARTGLVVVSSLYSERTIYGSPRVNWAQRALHDALHLKHGCDFSRHGELSCAAEATVRAVRRGSDRDLMRADAIGQVEHYFAFGAFPADQRAFVLDYLEHGRLTRSFA